MVKEITLTPTELKVIRFIQDYQNKDEDGLTPTNQQIAEFLGATTKGAANQILISLRKKGYIVHAKVIASRRKIIILKNIWLHYT